MTPSGDVYIGYIKKKVIPKGAETLYILGMWENKDVIENVCTAVEGTFEKHRTRRSKVTLTYKDEVGERRERRDQYLAILRRKEVGIFQSSR